MSIRGRLRHPLDSLPRLDAVPPSQTERAVIPGIPDCRYWMDRDISPFVRDVVDDNKRERESLARIGALTDPLPPAHLLAISGGSDSGAFAAGILVGWTKHGTRPQFRVVTGVSAGAFAAPFAYLGSDYDHVLEEMVSTVGPKDVFHARNLVSGIVADGFADSKPLESLVARYVTEDVLAAIVEESAKGRFLAIGTTDLDSGRAVTWNMGKIASSGSPHALSLFRKIMVASMSIPGAVSPVMMDVEVYGKLHQEMHVDGGVINQVFLYPAHSMLELRKQLGEPYNRKLHAYVIRNAKLAPEWCGTRRRTANISARALSALIHMQGFSNLEYIYNAAMRDGIDINMAYVENDFEISHAVRFDTSFMCRLYQYGYESSVKGFPWKKTLPTRVVQG